MSDCLSDMSSAAGLMVPSNSPLFCCTAPHTHTHTHTHAHTHMDTHTRTQTRTHTQTRKHTNTTNTHNTTHTHNNNTPQQTTHPTHNNNNPNTTHTHTHGHTHRHTHTHYTHTDTHTHGHTHLLTQVAAFSVKLISVYFDCSSHEITIPAPFQRSALRPRPQSLSDGTHTHTPEICCGLHLTQMN